MKIKKMESIFFTEDVANVLNADFIPWDELTDKTVLITGATGLIGTTLVKVLDYANEKKKLGIKMIALVRNEVRAKERFKEILEQGCLSFAVGSVEELPQITAPIDYIIHGASQTASKEFIEHAVETIKTSVLGTMKMLELAIAKKVKGFICLSSMEVYGYPEKGHKVTENEIGAMSPLNIRNSYPISKVMCEAMCCSYAKEYGVPAVICRLTQTFGPGVSYNDDRIFAYFGRCVKEKKNIVLKTKGETERSYLYTTDAVTAILTILLKGTIGSAYNAADEKTYSSIAGMAEKVGQDGGIEVEYDIQDAGLNGFPQTLYMDLDTTALKELGWRGGVFDS